VRDQLARDLSSLGFTAETGSDAARALLGGLGLGERANRAYWRVVKAAVRPHNPSMTLSESIIPYCILSYQSLAGPLDTQH
jgi:hypothetical protein